MGPSAAPIISRDATPQRWGSGSGRESQGSRANNRARALGLNLRSPGRGAERASVGGRQPGAWRAGAVVVALAVLATGASAPAVSTAAGPASPLAAPSSLAGPAAPAVAVAPAVAAAPTEAGLPIAVAPVMLDGLEVVRLSWDGVEVPDGATLTGYDVFTGRAPDGTGRTWYRTVAPRADGGGTVDIPATQRALGRYYSVVALFSDGTRFDGYGVGVGPASYVVLGDSFTAGQAVPPFELGTGADVDGFGGNTCHRSLASFGRLLVAEPALSALAQATTFAACSGAITADVLAQNLDEVAPEPAQVSRVDQFTDLITLSMGGNDVAFAALAVACAAGDCANYLGQEPALARRFDFEDAVARDTLNLFATLAGVGQFVHDGLGIDPQFVIQGLYSALFLPGREGDRQSSPLLADNDVLIQRLTRVYVSLANQAPHAQIQIVPYPQLMGGLGSAQECPVGAVVLDAAERPAWDLSLDEAERVEISRLIDGLNWNVAQAVDRANAQLAGPAGSAGQAPGGQRIRLVPATALDREFAGHRLCEDGGLNPDAYVNTVRLPAIPGVSSGNSTDPMTYSLHPNGAGQQAFERAVRPYVNFAIAQASPGQAARLPDVAVMEGVAGLRVEATWPAGTVLLSVVGPDGAVVDATSPGVRSGGDETSAWLVVPDPAPGTWTPRVAGAGVVTASAATGDGGAAGPEVKVLTTLELAEAPSPRAIVELSVAGGDPRAVTFDATGSTGSQGSLAYSWFFPDGERATGATVTHSFAAGLPVRATLRLDDGVSIPRWAASGVNTAPTAVDDTALVKPDKALTVAAPGVLANDLDVDGDALIATLDRPPAHGTVTLDASGRYVYTPAAGFVGLDSFTYHVADETLSSAPAVVGLGVGVPVVPATPTASATPASSASSGPSATPTPSLTASSGPSSAVSSGPSATVSSGPGVTVSSPSASVVPSLMAPAGSAASPTGALPARAPGLAGAGGEVTWATVVVTLLLIGLGVGWLRIRRHVRSP